MCLLLLPKIHVMKATGLPPAYCHSVFGQYKFWGQSEPTIITPLQVTTVEPDTLSEVELEFNHTQVTIKLFNIIYYFLFILHHTVAMNIY